MMEAVRDWIAAVVAVTMLLSVAQALIPEGGIRQIFSFRILIRLYLWAFMLPMMSRLHVKPRRW